MVAHLTLYKRVVAIGIFGGLSHVRVTLRLRTSETRRFVGLGTAKKKNVLIINFTF